MEHENAQTTSPCVSWWHAQALGFAGVGVCRCTQAGRLVYADATALEILGAGPPGNFAGTVFGRSFDSCIGQGFTPRPDFASLSGAAEVRNFETRRVADGVRICWIRFDAFTADDPVSGIPTVQILIQDITRERATEDALRTSERRFRRLAENIPGVIYLCKDDDRYTTIFANDQIEAVTGYAKTAFLNNEVRFGDLFHPEDVHGIREEVAEAVAKREPYHLVYRLRHRSGEWRWIEEHGAGVFDEESGKLLFLEGFVSDITGRHQAQTALKESEERYRFLAQNSTDLIARLDIDGRFVYVSPASRTLLGREPEELAGRSAFELFHPEELGRNQAFHEKIRGKPGRYSLEHRLGHADGTYPWVETSLNVTLNERTGEWEIIAVTRNVTERRRMREEIQRHAEDLEAIVARRTAQLRELEAQRAEMEKLAATGRMAAGAAHEINNPLTGIRNCLLILAKNVPEGHPDCQFVELAQREIERITRIVRQMYQLYRPEADTASRVQLGNEMHEVCLMLERKFAQKRLSIHFEIPDDLPDVLIPAGYLRQILYNLLVNAADASHEEGVIEFRASAAGHRIAIQVLDHGDGIARELLQRIFEPFFTTKGAREGIGMGLGLSVSRSLARAMNAELLVESTPGAGTVFSLALPPDVTLARHERTEP